MMQTAGGDLESPTLSTLHVGPLAAGVASFPDTVLVRVVVIVEAPTPASIEGSDCVTTRSGLLLLS